MALLHCHNNILLNKLAGLSTWVFSVLLMHNILNNNIMAYILCYIYNIHYIIILYMLCSFAWLTLILVSQKINLVKWIIIQLLANFNSVI